MPKSPNQTLIDQLLVEMEKQRDIIRQAKDAKRIIKELNRLIATLGGEAPSEWQLDEEDGRPPRPPSADPVVEPEADGTYTCPECGRKDFKRPQGVAAHRRQRHGVEGAWRVRGA